MDFLSKPSPIQCLTCFINKLTLFTWTLHLYFKCSELRGKQRRPIRKIHRWWKSARHVREIKQILVTGHQEGYKLMIIVNTCGYVTILCLLECVISGHACYIKDTCQLYTSINLILITVNHYFMLCQFSGKVTLSNIVMCCNFVTVAIYSLATGILTASACHGNWGFYSLWR